MVVLLRFIQIGMVASVALLFSLIAFGNLSDFQSNWLFVQHVMSMDTTFHHPAIMWRAVTNYRLQLMVYDLIIAWEVITAVICWIGCFIMLIHVRRQKTLFHSSKSVASLGLFVGFLLYMVGFIIIAGEWFCMWQSTHWNGQSSAGLFLMLILFTLLFLQQDERKE